MSTPPPIDAALMGILEDRLGNIGSNVCDACWQRGLLSSKLYGSLNMIRFLSAVLPFARAAQVDTGVPASLLIAEAFAASGGRSLDPFTHDVFNVGRQFGSLMDAFLHRAQALRQNPHFAAVMRTAHDPVEYLKAVARWSQHEQSPDLLANIESYGLAECDRLRPLN